MGFFYVISVLIPPKKNAEGQGDCFWVKGNNFCSGIKDDGESQIIFFHVVEIQPHNG